MSDARRLVEMFEADRDMPADEWYARFPMYAGDSGFGAKPWWPPLSKVWRHQGVCPHDYANAATDHWPEAWALLQRLHDEYRAAKQQA